MVRQLLDRGVPVYPDPERAARSLAAGVGMPQDARRDCRKSDDIKAGRDVVEPGLPHVGQGVSRLFGNDDLGFRQVLIEGFEKFFRAVKFHQAGPGIRPVLQDRMVRRFDPVQNGAV